MQCRMITDYAWPSLVRKERNSLEYRYMSVEQSRLSQFSCSLSVHAFPALMRTWQTLLKA